MCNRGGNVRGSIPAAMLAPQGRQFLLLRGARKFPEILRHREYDSRRSRPRRSQSADRPSSRQRALGRSFFSGSSPESIRDRITELAFAFHHFTTFRYEQIARFLAKQRNAALALPGLVMQRIKFCRRQLCRCNRALLIPFPENRAQASAIVSAKVSDDIIDLFAGNFCGDAVHS